MQRLTPQPPDKVCKTLEKLGFIQVRQKGSHIFYRHPDGRTTVVPFHKDEDLSKGLLAKIIRDCEISKEEFFSLL
ncbi:type II toxin-antitoxin system HicA family toxin [Methanolacinia paynteri]|uniref:type II toxin-antitoxin system HicA family toxin n=1 Tax=Methanolacinia paynteri TaxID=230356 RepID=UPI000A01B9F6|nr:type II toxin-antitoxin system HicA family toxin [Methanolacinia paynteri]